MLSRSLLLRQYRPSSSKGDMNDNKARILSTHNSYSRLCSVAILGAVASFLVELDSRKRGVCLGREARVYGPSRMVWWHSCAAILILRWISRCD